MDAADDELIAEFTVESLEGLANIEQQMLAIESAGAELDLELVNSVFRTMHSIKGTAGFLGLTRIGHLAHGLEEVLNFLRNREIVPSTELVTTVLKAADFMKDLIEAVESSNDADVSPYVGTLHQFRPGAAPMEPVAVDAPVPNVESAPAASSSAEIVATPSTIETTDATREFIIECYENLEQMDSDLLALEKCPASAPLLRGIFRTMHTVKGGAGFLGLERLERLAHAAENLLGKLRDGELAASPQIVSALLAAVNGCREGLNLLETRGNDAAFTPDALIDRLWAEQNPASAEPATSPVTPAPSAKIPTPSPIAPPKPAPAVAKKSDIAQAAAAPKAAAVAESAAGDKGTASVGDSTIRVDVALLDKLMTRVGELVLARNQILQYTAGVDNAAFSGAAQRLNLITAELQESVMKTRMQPIGNVWAKFPRVVRDLASQLGKQVAIEMEGKETELDKTIVEAIKDPLTHLVRNSVDHGIESTEVRTAAGKPA